MKRGAKKKRRQKRQVTKIQAKTKKAKKRRRQKGEARKKRREEKRGEKVARMEIERLQVTMEKMKAWLRIASIA